MCQEKSAEAGCGGEEKERKTEAEVDGQCECAQEGTVGRRCTTGLCGGKHNIFEIKA